MIRENTVMPTGFSLPECCQVAIVGGGPSGLAAATELARLGVNDVWVLEREAVAGGIPRHCGHPPFGMREFHRCYTGPQYAKKLVDRAGSSGVRIVTGASVVKIDTGGVLWISSEQGMQQLRAKRVLLCTGVRETPRSARLISGTRPAGILTTGALQSMIYLKRQIPCKRPIVVGTELVSFSALLTCRHAGIKPVAMLERSERITTWPASSLLPRILGVPLYRNTRVQAIQGTHRVERVQVCNENSDMLWLDCDGIIFSGQFIPESSLGRTGHLEIDPRTGGPRVNQLGQCSDPAYYACGNLLRPVETAGWCWREGVRVAGTIAGDLDTAGQRHTTELKIVVEGNAIKYVVPQQLMLPAADTPGPASTTLQVRLNHPASGKLQLYVADTLVAERKINSRPERRILFRVDGLPAKISDTDRTLRLLLKSS
jgi:NADPH-dependent 2,4-dienoyl-CoA reductase/sulfur reductase-like enzyme